MLIGLRAPGRKVAKAGSCQVYRSIGGCKNSPGQALKGYSRSVRSTKIRSSEMVEFVRTSKLGIFEYLLWRGWLKHVVAIVGVPGRGAHRWSGYTLFHVGHTWGSQRCERNLCQKEHPFGE